MHKIQVDIIKIIEKEGMINSLQIRERYRLSPRQVGRVMREISKKIRIRRKRMCRGREKIVYEKY